MMNVSIKSRAKGGNMKQMNLKKTKKSIRIDLIFSFTAMILIVTIALGVISINVASKIISNEAESTMIALAKDASKLEYSRLDAQNNSLKAIAAMKEIQSMDWYVQQPILVDMLKEANVLDFGILDRSGKITYSNNKSAQLSDSDAILTVLDGRENVVHFTISPETNQLILIQAVPIKKDNQVVGALIGRRDGSALSEMAKDSGYGKEGYGFIVNEEGTVIGHKNIDLVNSQYNPIKEVETDKSIEALASTIQNAISKESGIGRYRFNGNQQYVSFSSIQGTEWTFILVASESEILAPISMLRNIILILVAVVLMISVIITYFIGNSISKPIIKTIEYAKRIASLNLSEDIDEKFRIRKDEIGDLANALDSIKNGVRNIIYEISDSSILLTDASKNLLATSSQTALSSQEVAKVIEEIAQGASDQAKHTENGSGKAYCLGEAIEGVQSYIGNVDNSSKQVTKLVEAGLLEMDSLGTITQENTIAVGDIYDVIMKTSESSNQIAEASNVIESIASQTNLLSLNAAIEAARAGESGKGFAVVAEEIRKLAEQSASSTKEINEIVNALQVNAKNAVKTMERITILSKQQEDSVINNKNKYKQIEKAIKVTLDALESLSLQGNEMNHMRKDILEVLDNLSAIAQENAAAAEEASASTEEQTASVEEIAASSGNLSELAVKLHTLIENFKL